VENVATPADRFTAATADATGKSERAVRMASARGEALGDDLGAVTGTSLDKGMELDALAKLPKDERKGLIDRAKAGETGRARKEPKIAAEPLCDTLASETSCSAHGRLERCRPSRAARVYVPYRCARFRQYRVCVRSPRLTINPKDNDE